MRTTIIGRVRVLGLVQDAFRRSYPQEMTTLGTGALANVLLLVQAMMLRPSPDK